MRGRRRAGGRASAAALALSVVTLGCSAKDVGLEWLPEDVAVAHCTTAGRNKMPPVLLESPAPLAPTGLFARRLDPMALNDMGFQRDRPVCAGLIPPMPEAVETAGGDVQRLLEVTETAQAAALRALGRCACVVAFARGVRDDLPLCHEAKMPKGCDPDADDEAAFDEAIAPLTKMLETIDLPRIHWRLAGRTDRPTRLADRLPELLARHPGGATIHLPGEPIPARGRRELLGRLFEVPGTVAVVGQDSGSTWLVARVVDDALVLDYFAWPEVAPRYRGLLAALDDARPEALVRRLERPARHLAPDLDPTKGNIVMVDRQGLERMDELAIALAGLSEAPPARPGGEWNPPTALVDRVTLQAPFGHEGLALDVRARLSSDGRIWADALGDAPLSVDGAELGQTEPAPELVHADEGTTPSFWFRGQPAATTAIYGLSRVSSVLHALELEYPGSLRGTTRRWEITLPQGSIGVTGALPPGDGLDALAEVIAERPYEAVVTLGDGRLDIQLRPQ